MTKNDQKVINLRSMVEDLDSKIELLQKQKEVYLLKIQKLEKSKTSKGSNEE